MRDANDGAVFDKRLFREFFEPVVGVRLKWDAIAGPAYRVTAEVLIDGTHWPRVYLPWYHSDGMKAFSLGDPPSIFGMMGAERLTKIGRLAGGYIADPSVHHLTFPAFDIGSGRLLALDGCHRLSALSRVRVRSRVLALVIRGPADPAVLPDLMHWDGR